MSKAIKKVIIYNKDFTAILHSKRALYKEAGSKRLFYKVKAPNNNIYKMYVALNRKRNKYYYTGKNERVGVWFKRDRQGNVRF